VCHDRDDGVMKLRCIFTALQPGDQCRWPLGGRTARGRRASQGGFEERRRMEWMEWMECRITERTRDSTAQQTADSRQQTADRQDFQYSFALAFSFSFSFSLLSPLLRPLPPTPTAVTHALWTSLVGSQVASQPDSHTGGLLVATRSYSQLLIGRSN
jgi:hypothetical protein